jgi:predicted nucleotidyltransferase
MNVFYEFLKIVQHLQREGIEYALIGGVAMAFHAEPRFTKDIDLLVREGAVVKVAEILEREGYFKSSAPWTFKDTGLTVHRFMKVEQEDQMLVDVLVAGDERHDRIIRDAEEAESRGTGIVRFATKEDMIWLKRKRNSIQDRADIERLQNEKP